MKNISILLATTNPAKQHRLRWLLEGLPLTQVTPGEMGLGDRGPEEEGSSHEENARLKAEGWSRLLHSEHPTGPLNKPLSPASRPGTQGKKLVISSDGGLVIPALGHQWQSLLTHRFAGEGADDHARIERLLQLMQPYKGDERKASWVEALAIAEGGCTLASWEVEGANGILLEQPGRGPRVTGFWVFSLWYFPHLGKTYNELDEQELEGLNDHWSQLKALVQDFFQQPSPPSPLPMGEG